jgi:hypothetical protein
MASRMSFLTVGQQALKNSQDSPSGPGDFFFFEKGDFIDLATFYI